MELGHGATHDTHELGCGRTFERCSLLCSLRLDLGILCDLEACIVPEPPIRLGTDLRPSPVRIQIDKWLLFPDQCALEIRVRHIDLGRAERDRGMSSMELITLSLILTSLTRFKLNFNLELRGQLVIAHLHYVVMTHRVVLLRLLQPDAICRARFYCVI